MSMDLKGKRIVLGLTGGVACYKAAELCRALVKHGASVQVVMTEAATHFIGAVTMQAVSGNPVYLDQWDARMANNMAHIDLTRGADAILIAPCSADFIRKLVHGAADDLLSLLCVARPRHVPLHVAPAMNVEMTTDPDQIRARVAALLAELPDPSADDSEHVDVEGIAARLEEAHDLLVRALSMGKLHHAMMGTASVAIATAAAVPGTLVNQAAGGGPRNAVRFGHPSGSLRVGAEAELRDGRWAVTKAVMSRSARILMEGHVRVPEGSF